MRDRDRERERRRRRGQDDDAEPLEPFIATPFAEDEVDEAPETGMVGVEPGAEFGRLVHELPPVIQVCLAILNSAIILPYIYVSVCRYNLLQSFTVLEKEFVSWW